MLLTLASSEFGHAADILLPDLGDASTGLITPRQEYELGQKWLRLYRAKVPTSSDPFLQSYTEDMIRGLSYYSDLDDKRLSVLVIANQALNAFAVPGGVIGVHTGLFEYADTEDQFASVLAHELAHLSQRHYARRVADQKEKALSTMAGLLASILLAATAGGDVGIAAISAAQAVAIESQLRFSRQMEQEADRIGMETMVRSGKNPEAMGDMFENMLKSQRYSQRPPEFLLTHPLTESRVSDAKVRALKYDQKFHPQSLEYQFARIHAVLANENNTQLAIRRLENELEGNKYPQDVATYGLVVALTRANKSEAAKKLLTPLLATAPENLYYLIAMAEIEAEEKNFDAALKRLREQIKRFPKHHALNIRFAEILMKASKYEECENLLLAHSQRRPKDDYVWYLLAEVHGLVGNIFAVHTARAEYFLLNGLYDKAIIQLENAQKIVKKDKYLLARVEQRLKYAMKLKVEDRL
ncbi:MAG: M48 family metalloprotease [Agarilytica sp.]